MSLDVVLAGPGLEELFLAEAEQIELGGVRIPVIRAEHLVVTKILAGRTKDLEDARELLAGRRSELDLDLVRSLLAELEDALGQSDLLPTFDDLLRDRDS
jgi:predicted nucleotidyltransferase